MKLFAIIEEQNEYVQAILIQEMLLRTAKEKGIEAEVRLHKLAAPLNTPPTQNNNDILLYIGGKTNNNAYEQVLAASFRGTILYAEREMALNHPQDLWQKIESRTTGLVSTDLNTDLTDANGRTIHKIVAVTSCPTGIAHTFMAAEALEEGAKALNIPIRVETQGSVGAGTPLTKQEISAADLVIIAADREVDRSRFNGKYIYTSRTKPAISDGKSYIQGAIKEAKIQQTEVESSVKNTDEKTAEEHKGGFYPPLMTGVSFMLPFVIAGGLLIAIGLAISGVNVENETGFGHILWQIGAKSVFPLIVPVLAGYIAFAIADRPAIAPGMVGGFLSDQIGAGFIGGIIAGFLAGYITKMAIHYIRLPQSLNGLKPMLILPLLCTALTGLIMVYVIQTPTVWLLEFLTHWVKNLENHSNETVINVLLLGAVMGGMMAVDMGGPINKAAYTVAIGLLSVKAYSPMAAVMIGGMTPPLSLALACILRPHCFTEKERKSKEATFVMGLAFISEGAIPFASRDPLRIIPCLIAGSAIGGAISTFFRTGIVVPHGGIFLLPIQNAIINYGGYFAALIGGTIVSAVCLCLACRPITEDTARQNTEETATV